MRIKKLLFISSLIIIIFSIYRSFKYFTNAKEEVITQIKTINEIKNQTYTTIPYIEIPSFNFQRIIIDTTNLQNENKTYIGIFNEIKMIDKIAHLVLAGHNTKAVFGFLYKIKNNELINIYYKDKKYIYKVQYKKIINVKELHYLKEHGNYLTLITCTNNDQQRLIVRAKKIKEELL